MKECLIFLIWYHKAKRHYIRNRLELTVYWRSGIVLTVMPTMEMPTKAVEIIDTISAAFEDSECSIKSHSAWLWSSWEWLYLWSWGCEGPLTIVVVSCPSFYHQTVFVWHKSFPRKEGGFPMQRKNCKNGLERRFFRESSTLLLAALKTVTMPTMSQFPNLNTVRRRKGRPVPKLPNPKEGESSSFRIFNPIRTFWNWRCCLSSSHGLRSFSKKGR